MFTFSRTFTGLTAAAAFSIALASTAGAQTVVGGFAKNGGPRVVQSGALNGAGNATSQTVRLPGGGTTRIMAPKPRTTGLPNTLKGGIENLSRTRLDTVRVHRGSKSPSALRAKAYAKGTKIHIAPGQAKHLAHEPWHVTQQKQGRVRPLSRNANRLNFAKEADALGKSRRASTSVKSAKTVKSAHNVRKSARFARNAKTANTIRKSAKAANAARNAGKAALMGTGVGAVVGVTAGLAGVDPVEMAMLKATNPGEYNRRMRNLKKNPVKYMGNNIKKNTVKTVNDVKKAGQTVGNATKKAGQAVGNATKKAAADVGKATKTAANKVGCGVGNIFKKKNQKKKC